MPALAARADDADRDLAAVGDEDAPDHHPRPARLSLLENARSLPGPRPTRAAPRLRAVVRPITSSGALPATSRISALAAATASGPTSARRACAARPRRRAPPPARPRGPARSRARARRRSARRSGTARARPTRRSSRSTNGEITAGRMPSFTSVKPNTRVLGGDDDVADRGQAGAAAERRALDAADQRHRQRVERARTSAPGPRRRAGSRSSRVGDRLRHPGEVGAGAERLAGAGEHDGAQSPRSLAARCRRPARRARR